MNHQSNQEQQSIQLDHLHPDELDTIVSTVDSMMTDEYYPMDDDGLLCRSKIVDSFDQRESYYIAQYLGDSDNLMTFSIPDTDDDFINISPDGRIELEQGGVIDPIITDKRQYVFDLVDKIHQSHHHEQAIMQAGLEFASVQEPAAIGEPIRLAPEESQAILELIDFATVVPDSRIDGNVLIGLGLEPVLKMDLTDQLSISMSRPYSYNKRNYVIALAEHGEEVLPRVYYQSLSQSTWRYLPGIEEDVHHSKSGTEDGLNLPLEVQSTLDSLLDNRPISIEPDIAYEVTKAIAGRPNHYEQKGLSGINPLQPNIIGSPMVLPGVFLNNGSLEAVCQPEDVTYDEKMSEKYPDFDTTTLLTASLQSSQYGKLAKYQVSSADGQWRYVFARDELGRSWLTMAEDLMSPINKLGLRVSHPSLGLLTAPADEYRSQANEFAGDPIDGTNYVDIYHKLLSRFKIIRDFEAKLAEVSD